MGFGATNALLRLYPALAGIALSCLATGTAFAQRGQLIEFSSPQSGVMVSNLNQLGTKQFGLKQLEEDQSRPFESLNPDNSLGAVVAAPYRPPPRPRIPNKRDKEREDLRKNWVFVNPDDLTKGPSPEKIFGLKEYDKNGEEKKTLSAVEKYYQNLNRKRGDANEGTDDPGVNRDKDAVSFLRSTDRRDTLGGNADEPDQLLRGILNSDLDSKLGDRLTTLNVLPFSGPVNIDGFQTDRLSPQQARWEEFKQLVDPGSASTTGALNPFYQQTDPTRSSLNPAKGLEAFTIPTRRDTLNPLSDGLNRSTVFQPAILQDMNARALGQPSLTPVLQPTPPPKPPPAALTFPSRKF